LETGLRVVLDTNVLFSGVASPNGIPASILEAWRIGGLRVVLSQHILEELVRVLPRLRKASMAPIEIRTLAETFRLRAEIAEPDSELDPDLRDPADQLVLATLRVSQADYLITGHKDLLALAGKHPILTPAEFWARHG
jgi:putative PIN family toxin of toxin-antitoxin system